jgi:hypothetical protein
MVQVNPWTDDTFDTLYDIFRRDFVETRPRYEQRPVWHFPEKDSGRELIFWHLTHREDKITKERLPDLRRSERLSWVRKVIEAAGESGVLAWDYLEGGGRVNTYVWLKDHDFLVLMRRCRNGERRLITSYYVDYPHKRRKLEGKYSKRIT